VLVVMPLPVPRAVEYLTETQVGRVCLFSRQFLSTILVVLLAAAAAVLAVPLIFPSRVPDGGVVVAEEVGVGQPILPAVRLPL
jgi:hypothetical protein